MRAIGLFICAFIGALCPLSANCEAGLIITVEQVGANVVLTGSGTLNLGALTNVGPAMHVASGMEPSTGSVDVGSASPVTDDQYSTTFTGSTVFGTGGPIRASSGTGQTFGFFQGDLQVPSGYISGSSLAGTAVLNGQTFASLHVTPGTYTITWGNGGNADFFTVQVGPSLGPRALDLRLAQRVHRGGNRIRPDAPQANAPGLIVLRQFPGIADLLTRSHAERAWERRKEN